MNETRLLSLGLVFFLSINVIAAPTTGRSIVVTTSSQSSVIEKSMVALAEILHQWSGHRTYENLVIALADEVAKYNSIDPLVTTAARMAHLAAGLGRQDLYREAIAVLKALKPEVAAGLRSNQQILWRVDGSSARPTIYEKLGTQHSNAEIFGTQIFENEDMEEVYWIERESKLKSLDARDPRVQSAEDYITDALYGSFEDEYSGAASSRQNPIVQKVLADREAVSVSAGGQYFRDIVDDGMRGAGVGGVGGSIAGLYVAGPPGAATAGTVGAAAGFVVGAAAGAVTHYDDYQTAKAAEAQAAQKKAEEEKQKQQNAEQEKADKADRERKEQAKKDEEEVERLKVAQQTSNTATGVNPARAEEKGSGVLRLVELLTHFRKLINIREGAAPSQGLAVLVLPNSGSMDPGRFDLEYARGGSFDFEQAGVKDPCKNSMSRGGNR
jgi:hypothetical protein